MPYLSGINFDNGLNPNALYTNMAENIAHFRAKRAERTNMLNQSQQLLTTSGRDKNVSVVVDEDNRVHAVGKNGKEDANAMQALYGNKKTDLSMNGKGTSVNKTIDLGKTQALTNMAVGASQAGSGSNAALNATYGVATDLRNKGLAPITREDFHANIASELDKKRQQEAVSKQLENGAALVPDLEKANTDAIKEMQPTTPPVNTNPATATPPVDNKGYSARSGVKSGMSESQGNGESYTIDGSHTNANVKMDPVTRTVQTVDNSFNDEIQTSLQDLQYQQGMASMLGHGDQGIANTYAQMFQKRAADVNAQNALRNQNGTSVVEDGGKIDISGGKDEGKVSQGMNAKTTIQNNTNVTSGNSSTGSGAKDPKAGYQYLDIGGNATIEADRNGRLTTNVTPSEAVNMIAMQVQSELLRNNDFGFGKDTSKWTADQWTKAKTIVAKQHGLNYSDLEKNGLKSGANIGSIMRNKKSTDIANASSQRIVAAETAVVPTVINR